MINISVIMPFYNVKEFIYEALESLTKQGLEQNTYEVIMVDDGSNDGSKEIAQHFENKYEEFILLSQDNQGLGAARNNGADIAKGKYIIFFDSDDVIPDNTYKKMLDKIEETNSTFVTINVKRLFYSNIRRSPLHEMVFKESKDKTNIYETPELIYDSTAWNKLINREWFVNNNFKFPERMLYEDIPVTMVMFYTAPSIDVIYDVGYLWRQRDGSNQSITQNRRDIQNFLDRKKAINFVRESISKLNLDENIRNNFIFKSISLDIPIYFSTIPFVTEEYKNELIEFSNELINLLPKSMFDSIPIRVRVEYGLIKAKKIEELIEYELRKAERKIFFTAITPMQINSYKVENEFTKMISDFNNNPLATDFTRYTLIDKININNEGFKLLFDTFFYGVNANNKEAIKAMVEINDYDSNSVLLFKNLIIEKNEENKYLHGYVKDQPRTEEPTFNYDYSKFKLDLSNDELREVFSKTNSIYFQVKISIHGLSYSFRLNNNMKDFERIKVNSFNNCFDIKVDEANDIVVTNYPNAILVEDVKLSSNKENVIVKTSHNNKELILMNEGKEIIGENNSTENETYFKADNFLSKSNRGKFYITSKNGNEIFLDYRLNRNTNIVIGKNRLYLVDNLNENPYILNSFVSMLIDNVIFNDSYMEVFVSVVKDVLKRKNDILTSIKFNLRSSEANIEFKLNKYKENDNVVVYTCKIPYSDMPMYNSQFDIYIKTKHLRKGNTEYILRFGSINMFVSFRGKYMTYNVYSRNNTHLNRTRITLKRNNGFANRIENYNFLSQNYLKDFKNHAIEENKAMFIVNSKNFENYLMLSQELKKQGNIDSILVTKKGYINVPQQQLVDKSRPYWEMLAKCKYIFFDEDLPIEYYKKEEQILISLNDENIYYKTGINSLLNTHPKRRDNLRTQNNIVDFRIVSGRFFESKVRSGYQGNEKLLRYGMPQYDLMKKTGVNENELRNKYNIPKNSKVVLFELFERTKSKVRLPFRGRHLLNKTDEDIYFIIICERGCECNISNADLGDRGRVVKGMESITDYLMIADVLVSDYTTTANLMSLTSKPTIFFIHDHDLFNDNLAEIDFDYYNNAPGIVANSESELFYAINNIDNINSNSTKKYMLNYLEYYDQNASEKIISEILEKGVK